MAFRTISVRGQFNALHRFSFDPVTGQPSNFHPPAKDSKEFKALTTNPGPLRVVFSPDYLDWYFKAYTARARHARLKARARTTFPWSSPKSGTQATVDHPEGGAAEGSVGGGPFRVETARPASSPVRREAELRMARALDIIDDASLQHAQFDLYERQSHFPQIHIDKATDHHIRELVKTLFIDSALSYEDVWRKALLYRAILSERRASYPAAYQYIMSFVDGCRFAPVAKDDAELAIADDAARAANDAALKAATYLPSTAWADYYRALVQIYHVENNIDAHVVLECHLAPNAEALLQSQPPPREDVKGPDGNVIKLPLSLPRNAPPLPSCNHGDDPFLRDENMPLMRCLVFGEFNLSVNVDPFVKYPKAQSTVIRPSPTELRMSNAAKSVIERMSRTNRTLFFAGLTPAQQTALETRSKDISRLEQMYSRQDAMFDRELSKLADDDPALWGAAYESPFYNPRTIRPELRDRCSRTVTRGLRDYDRARAAIQRPGSIFDLESTQRFRGRTPAVSVHRPSIPRFLHLIMSDKHVHFVLTMFADVKPQTQGGGGGDGSSGGGGSGGQQPTTLAIDDLSLFASRLRAAATDLSVQMLKLALEFHLREARRIHYRKVQIASALLDNVVQDGLAVIKTHPSFQRPFVVTDGKAGASPETADQPPSLLSDSPAAKAYMALGVYVPFGSRALSELGYPTPARMDDYVRWMKAQPLVRTSTELPRPPSANSLEVTA